MKEKTLNTMTQPVRLKPNLTLSESDLPSISKWEIGKKYKLTIEVMNKRINIDEYGEKKEIHTQLDVVKVKEVKGREGTYDKGVVEKAYSM